MHDYNQVLYNFESLGVYGDWGLPTDKDIRFAYDVGCFDTFIISAPPVSFHNPIFKSYYSARKIEERIRAIKRLNMTPVIMDWLVRSTPFIKASCEFFGGIAKEQNLLYMHDCEAAYHTTRGSNAQRIGPSQAAELVVESTPSEVEWGVTGLMRLHPTLRPLVMLAHVLSPQPYCFWKRPWNTSHWSHSAHTFPGYQQRESHKSWVTDTKVMDKKIIFGAAGYDNARPAQGKAPFMPAHDTMELAFGATVRLGVYAAWVWSVRNLRAKRNVEALRFFRGF